MNKINELNTSKFNVEPFACWPSTNGDDEFEHHKWEQNFMKLKQYDITFDQQLVGCTIATKIMIFNYEEEQESTLE